MVAHNMQQATRVSDIERIGDHAVNLAEYVEFMQTGRLKGE